MVLIPVLCPCCKSNNVVKRGMTNNGKQRYLCQEVGCITKTFIRDYTYLGCLEYIKRKIIDMAMNGSGIRDTARTLEISPVTVINELKKKEHLLEFVNKDLLQELDVSNTYVKIQIVKEAEMDEMWSYVGSKDNQRWLWHAIDHASGKTLAYTNQSNGCRTLEK